MLRARFGLDAVHLAPTIAGPEDLTRRMVGRLAAEVLRGALRDGATVGIGDGASVSATAAALEETATPVAVTVVPLCGGYWSTGQEREPYRRVADALGGQARGLMSPGLVDDAATRRALVAHAGVRAIVDLWERLDVALFGIGGPAWSVARVGEPVERELEAAEAVGEVLVAPFDLDGRFVCPALRERVIALDARRLDGVPVSIGVAAGEGKVRPILGALRAGVVGTLVTDVATAEAVVALDDARPRQRDPAPAPTCADRGTPGERASRPSSGSTSDDRGQGGPGRPRRPAARPCPERLRARRVGRPRLGGTGSRGVVVGRRQRGPGAAGRGRRRGRRDRRRRPRADPRGGRRPRRGDSSGDHLPRRTCRRGGGRLTAATGIHGWSLGGLPAALWVERHEPAVAAATRWYLATWEWLAFRLTGVADAPLVPDQATADPALLAAAGIATDRLPPSSPAVDPSAA